MPQLKLNLLLWVEFGVPCKNAIWYFKVGLRSAWVAGLCSGVSEGEVSFCSVVAACFCSWGALICSMIRALL